MPRIQATMAHAYPLCALLPLQRPAVDTVRHHLQHCHPLLQRRQQRRQLDVYDLHGALHTAYIPGVLAAR